MTPFDIGYFFLGFYPIFGALFWILSGVFYALFDRYQKEENYRFTNEEPLITILVPAHNEELMIEKTVTYLLEELNYTNYEVIVIDDASKDRTYEILEKMAAKHENLKIIRIEENQGKAHAFNVALAFSSAEYILSNDADTVPEADALKKYMQYFLSDNGQTAAVTANMDVSNRENLVEKSQVVEFSSIVGLIKRSQMIVLKSMYAYSGANTMYRKSALIDVGLFRQDRATEDISICWDHQINGWKSVFAPNIIFHMNVPNTIRMLFRQRKRWAQGGTEVWLSSGRFVLTHPIKYFNQFVMYLDQTASISWSFFYVVSLFFFIKEVLFLLATGEYSTLIFKLELVFIYIFFQILVGMIQITVALFLDRKYDKMKYLIYAPFYLLWYWQVNPFTIVLTFVPAVKSILGYGKGTWKSPTRVVTEKEGPG